MGWEIDIKGKEEKAPAALETAGKEETAKPEETQTETQESSSESGADISEIEGVGDKTRKALVEAGYDTIEKLKGLTAEDLVKIDGIGAKTAEKIIRSAREFKG